jgi:D-alanyl-D-alanine carboxypeptidase
MKYFFVEILFLSLVFLSSPAYGFQVETDKIFEKTIQSKLDSIYDPKEDFGGATIGIILPDESSYSFALGYSDMNNNVRMSTKNRMLGGSTGKILVSASIMQQVEKGTINLDDKLQVYLGNNTWFGRIQNFDKITIRNLLQHSSGISRYVFNEEFLKDVQLDADRFWSPPELLSYVFDKESLFSPGSEFAYSDTNYILLALVLEKVSGLSMYEYINDHILSPFKLDNIHPQLERSIEDLPIGYNGADDVLYPGIVVQNGKYKYNLQFEWGGGGFVVTSTDLARVGKLIWENKVFSQSLNADFFDGIEATGLGGHWGLGVHIMTNETYGKSYGHSGFFPGYVTNLLYFPEYGFSIAYQVNTSERDKLGLFRKINSLIPEIQKYLDHEK